MASSFENLLDRLLKAIEPVNPNLIEALNDGLEEEVIKDRARSEGLVFPQDLIELYHWKNGTNLSHTPLSKYVFFPSDFFIDLEQALLFYHTRASKEDDPFWKEFMFPILGSGGDYFLIDLNVNSPTYNMIYFYCLSATDYNTTVTKFDSLTSFIEGIYQCYKNRVYYMKEVILDWDFEREVEIQKKLNPKSEFWKL